MVLGMKPLRSTFNWIQFLFTPRVCLWSAVQMQAVSKYSRNRRFVTTTTFCNRIDWVFSTIQPFDENMEFIPLEQRHPDVLLFRGFIKDQTYITKIHWNGSNWQKSQYLLPRENISNISRGCFLVKTMDVCHTSSATRLTYCWCSKVTLYLLIIIALLVPYAVMSDKHSDIPHICHHRRRCTFFKLAYLFKQRTRKGHQSLNTKCNKYM